MYKDKSLSSKESSDENGKKNPRFQSVSGVRQSIYLEPNRSNQSTFYACRTDRIKYRVTPAITDGDRTLHPEFLQLLIRHTWNLCRLSPLYNLNFREAKLKQYAARIKRALVVNIKDSANNITYNVTVSVISETNENFDDFKSLEIEVTKKKGDSDPQITYRGIILFCDNKESSDFKPTHYPLLLCTGNVSVQRIVNRTLQELFDTIVHSFRISQEDIMWLSVLTSFANTCKTKNVVFYYLIPKQSIRNSMTAVLECSYLHRLWNKVHPAESDEILYEEIESFYKNINESLARTYGVRFEKLQLHKIILPEVTLNCAGKIKFHSEETTIKVLDFLLNISQILDSPCPAMSYKCEL